MKESSKIKRNSVLSFLSSIIRFLTTSLMFIGIARIFGAEIFGSFASAYALASLFVIVADFGFDLLLTTKVAHEPSRAHEFLEELFSLKLLFSFAALGLIWILPLVRHLSSTTQTLVLILSFTVIFNALTNFFLALFRGIEQFFFEIKISIFANVYLFCCLLLAGFFHASITTVALLFVSSRALGLFLAVQKATQILTLRSFKLTLNGWRYFDQILTFGFALIFGHLFLSLITPMITFIKGDYDTGIYESVFKLVASILMLADVGVNALLPTLTRYYSTDVTKWAFVSRMFNKILFIISLPIAFVFLVYPGQLISVIYGQYKFQAAIPVMQLAGLVVFIRFTCESFGLMLTTSGRQNIRMRITLVGTVVSILLCLILIPSYGFMGATIASLSVNTLVGLANAYSVKKEIWQWIKGKDYILPLLFTLSIGFITASLNKDHWHYTIILSLAVLILLLFIFGFSKEDRKRFYSIGEIIK